MPAELTCPQCGTALSSNTVDGLCPICLGQAAFANASTVPKVGDAGEGALSPEIEAELARLKPEEAGERIGPYKLLQSIGEGGFGTVWMAEQEHPVRRRVALKIIKLGMNTKEVIARFEQERQALAMMEHPNIAKVLDAGATRWGRPFFAMELVRGIKITDYCDQANLSTVERLGLFIQTCNAIQHAHQKGIIHRDIKPSNILVTMHDGVPVPKVIDFGVAKATQQQRLTDLTLFTQFEQMIGTPLYMSPEQAEMSGLDIDTRSDIYSLGVLLYELLTGRTPFDPEELMRKGYDEIRRAIREQEPKRPSTFVSTMAVNVRTTVAQHRQSDPTRLTGLLRGDLDWIVMKAIEKDRTRRYETANGFAKDIERHLANEPVLARPPSTLYGFRRFVKRHKVGFAASSFIAIALIVGLGTSTWLFFKEREARQRAVASERGQEHLRVQAQAEKERAETEANKSQQVARFLQNILKVVGPQVALGQDTKLLVKILDGTAQEVGNGLKAQPAVEAELRETMGGVYFDLGEWEKSEVMYREALRLNETAIGESHDKTAARLLNRHGHALAELRQPPKAEELFKQALALNKSLYGEVNEGVAMAHYGLGRTAFLRGDLDVAQAYLRESLDEWKQLGKERSAEATLTLNDLGLVLCESGKPAEAVSVFEDCLAKRTRTFGEINPGIAEARGNLGMAQNRLGDLQNAEKALRQTVKDQTDLLPKNNVDAASTRNNLAMLLMEKDDFAEAEAMQRDVLEVVKQSFPGPIPNDIAARKNLAKVLRRRGAHSGNLGTLLEALQINPGDQLTADAFATFKAKPLSPIPPEQHATATAWQYTDKQPDPNWFATDFHPDPAKWAYSPPPRGGPTFFPRKETTPITSHAEIWLRREFELSEIPDGTLHLRLNRYHDAQVFLNGKEVCPTADWSDTDVLLPCQDAAASSLRIGRNVMAVHCEDADHDAPIDVRLYLTSDANLGRNELIDELGRMIAQEREPAEFYSARASAFARLGQWKNAEADLCEAIKLRPSMLEYWCRLAPILLQTEDRSGYRARRHDALNQFAREDRPDSAEKLCRLALLAPLAGDELQTALRLSARGTAAEYPAGLASRQFTKGLAAYRAGNFKDTIALMGKLITTSAQKNLPGWNHERERNWTAAANVVMAMAQHRGGDTKTAGDTLTQARRFMDEHLPRKDGGDLGREWSDYLLAGILRREAETLIGLE